MKKPGLVVVAILFCVAYAAYVWMTPPGGTTMEKQIGASGRILVTGMQACFVFWFALSHSDDWRLPGAVSAVIGTALLFLAVIVVTGTAPITLVPYVIVAWPSIWLSAVLAGALTLWRALAVGLFLPPLALALDLLLGRLGLYGSYNFTT